MPSKRGDIPNKRFTRPRTTWWCNARVLPPRQGRSKRSQLDHDCCSEQCISMCCKGSPTGTRGKPCSQTDHRGAPVKRFSGGSLFLLWGPWGNEVPKQTLMQGCIWRLPNLWLTGESPNSTAYASLGPGKQCSKQCCLRSPYPGVGIRRYPLPAESNLHPPRPNHCPDDGLGGTEDCPLS